MQLILLPGLGADNRLFAPQAAAFPDLTVPAWLPPRDDEELPEYAARLAPTVCFRGSGPRVLGGASLGGMIAWEMARHLRPDVLVLIATCHSREGLRAWQRGLGPIVPWTPLAGFRLAQSLSPLVSELGRFHRETVRRELVAMFRDADIRFMRWALAALLRWSPSPPAEVPTFHIHGAQDRIIPAARVDADELIPDGGHMINVTHPERVNAFIRKAASTAE